ncbi:MAG: cyclodeaminase/cyclohydrolase family protein, partial [Chloroflexi bacterium]|nr:cyclodeaminase/cyclohydrolase family protein [Chloroflexota bacterium]
KLPKASEEEINIRGIAIEAAMLHAAKVPLGVAEMAVEAMELASIVTEIGNLNAISDGASGNAVARASFTGAVLNVKINLASLTDQDETKKLIESISSLEKRADSAEAKVNANIKNRADL